MYNGALSGFGEALELARAQFAVERAMAARDVEDRAGLAEMEVAHAQISAATRHAGRVYREEQEAARLRTIDRLRADALAAEAALEDEAARWLGLLATALEQGDYAELAI